MGSMALTEKAVLKKARGEGWDQWIRSEADMHAARNGCYFDEKAANHVIEFFSTFLHHYKGEWKGQPFVPLEWQSDELLKPLFGWKRADGYRRYRMGYVEIPKKNGKTETAAGITLYMLVADNEPGAECYSAAADREQASIIYRCAEQMVGMSPALDKSLTCVPSRKRIVYFGKASFYQALSADVPSKEGMDIHFTAFDELHAQQNRKMWDTLEQGAIARRQPMQLSITTAGYDRETICWEVREIARKVIEGKGFYLDSFFAYIRCADPEDDWKSPETWKKANPSYGIIIKEDDMVEACKLAQESPLKENNFKRYRLNLWTAQQVRWLRMDRWDECDATIDESMFEGRECYGALDLSSTTDITAYAKVFPPMGDDDKYTVICRFWLPEGALDTATNKNAELYRSWAQRGYLELTPGDSIDDDYISNAVIGEYQERFNILEMAVDRWNASHAIAKLEGEGLTMIAFGQGFASMSSPSKSLETLVLSRRIRHGGNPILRWMANNVAVRTDPAGNIKPDKEKSTEKIDGIVATIMALDRAIRHENQVGVRGMEVWA